MLLRYNLPNGTFFFPNRRNIMTKHKDTPQSGDFSTLSEVFKLLGDSSRVKLFWLLCHCEECVLNLSVMMEMSSPAVSHHLKLLKSGGLIVNRRDGKEMYYKAAETEQAQLLHDMIEKIVKISCP